MFWRRVVLWSALFVAPMTAAWAEPLTLWYQQPAIHPLTEGLPIGNGRMGALILGGSQTERLVLDEDSLWTGGLNPSGNYDTMGAYQFLGDLLVHLPAGDISDYRRELNLETAEARVSYSIGDVQFAREYFCSRPDIVLVGRFTATKPGSYTGSVELKDSHGGTLRADGDNLTVTGSLENGLKYAWQICVLHDGGSVQAKDNSLEFTHCNSLTILVAAATDYAMKFETKYRDDDPAPRVQNQIRSAANRSYDQLSRAHVEDYQSLFNRVSLNLGASSESQRNLPTDKRKLAAFEKTDPELEALLFQYGRYLLIASSRPGGLPANLQGLWNDSNNPPWHSDYHANINIEMNYWPAEVGALPECHLPFFDLVTSQLPAWREASANSPELKTPDGSMTKRGWAIRTSHNITGGMGWKWDKTANAWYCHQFWEHFEFTGDTIFLRHTAFPVMKEICEFWEDHLKTDDEGKLVVPNGWSPEHGPEQDGVSYNQEIVWDLFDNFVHACDVLDTDRDYRDKIASMRDLLATPGIGSWGQLLEWRHELHDPKSPELDTPNDHHRHTSHLFAVYPGHQVSPVKTPKLAAAAKVSLDARGIDPKSDVREWSFAWRTALYARLGAPESAHEMLQQLFSSRNTCPNLFGLHPPMQIDGDFGITAGIAEMLLQSQADEIHLLPALPRDWPAGSAKGLRARAGFTVDQSWQSGKLTEATLHSKKDTDAVIRYGSKTVKKHFSAGQTIRLDGELR